MGDVFLLEVFPHDKLTYGPLLWWPQNEQLGKCQGLLLVQRGMSTSSLVRGSVTC